MPPFTAVLLTHLQRAGFEGCPRYLAPGVLSFLPGDVPAKWRRFDDDQVAAAAALLRRLHDASRDLAATLGGEVVCHHDCGPNNTVFRAGRPVAFIDFDFAAPGERLEDGAYVVWAGGGASRPERGPATEQGRQIRVLADAYGLTAGQHRRLLPALVARLDRNVRFWQGQPAVLAGPSPAEVVAWTRREAAFVGEHAADLEV